MLVLFPLLFFGLAFLAHRRFGIRTGEEDWRDCFAAAAIGWGVAVVVIVEISSALWLFRPLPVLALWLLLAVAAAVLLFRRRPVRAPKGMVLRGQEPPSRALLAGAALVILPVGLVALAAPPNTWDAMTYHMARVAQWIQNGSVSFYPTHVIRQLDFAPWAEYAIANLTLLAGSDRFANGVQWFALLGSVVGASLAARELGGGGRAQAGAAVAAVTLPMAILQGSSAQNDLVAGSWLLLLAVSVLRLRRRPQANVPVLGAGASLGLALLTKGTSYLFTLPFAVWLLLILARERRAKAWRPLLGIAILVSALNLPHALRNWSLFGSPLGARHGVLNERLAVSAVASNALRSLAIHLASPVPAGNRAIEDAVAGLHRLMGADPSDPRTTWKRAAFRVPPATPGAGAADPEEALYAMLHEDTAGNPLHLLLLISAAVFGFGGGARRRAPGLPAFAAAALASFLLFCLVLKWQPWNARLQLPLFMLGAPLIAVALFDRPGRLSAVLPTLLLIAALPWVVANATRPLVGPENVFTKPRFEQYFANRPGLLAPGLAAGRVIGGKGCDRVGLEIRSDDGEYLFRMALERQRRGPLRIQHIAVRNFSARLAGKSRFARFSPCAILVSGPAVSASPSAGGYRFPWAGGLVRVLIPVSGAAAGR